MASMEDEDSDWDDIISIYSVSDRQPSPPITDAGADFLIDIFEGPVPKPPPPPPKRTKSMFAKRRKTRPLGSVAPETRLEMQIEKAIFKSNVQMLNQIVSRKSSRYIHPNSPEPSSSARYSERSNDLRSVNNAASSVFHKKIIDRVMSAQAERRQSANPNRRFNIECPRQESDKSKYEVVRNSHCDVLGPYFCTDCTQIRHRSRSAYHQRRSFPRIECRPRSLIAPDKLEKLMIPTPYDNDVTYGGEIWDGNTTAFYSIHDVQERLRQLHKEKGVNAFGENRKRISKSAGLIPSSVFTRKQSSTTDRTRKPSVHFSIPGSQLTTTMTTPIRIPTTV